jgi:hypothetical protein
MSALRADYSSGLTSSMVYSFPPGHPPVGLNPGEDAGWHWARPLPASRMAACPRRSGPHPTQRSGDAIGGGPQGSSRPSRDRRSRAGGRLSPPFDRPQLVLQPAILRGPDLPDAPRRWTAWPAPGLATGARWGTLPVARGCEPLARPGPQARALRPSWSNQGAALCKRLGRLPPLRPDPCAPFGADRREPTTEHRVDRPPVPCHPLWLREAILRGDALTILALQASACEGWTDAIRRAIRRPTLRP